MDVVDFLRSVCSAMDISQQTTRVAMFEYSEDFVFEFHWINNPSQLISAIDGIRYEHGSGTYVCVLLQV